jgi:predicted ArsR family transcriptional regulator
MVIRGEDGVAQNEIRRRNLSRILRELHLSGPLSRSELATELSLNRSTVASLIGELAARGLVWEHTRSKSLPQAPGRPSPVVELRRDGPGALAVDLSTDWIGAAVIGLGG